MLAFADVAEERTLCGIVFEQMSQHLRAGKIIDCNNFVAFGVEHLTESQTADTTEAVNSDFYRHETDPP